MHTHKNHYKQGTNLLKLRLTNLVVRNDSYSIPKRLGNNPAGRIVWNPPVHLLFWFKYIWQLKEKKEKKKSNGRNNTAITRVTFRSISQNWTDFKNSKICLPESPRHKSQGFLFLFFFHSRQWFSKSKEYNWTKRESLLHIAARKVNVIHLPSSNLVLHLISRDTWPLQHQLTFRVSERIKGALLSGGTVCTYRC